MSFLRKRLGGDEKGFTLIELLVVVIIIGILTAIAVPAYLSFRGKANDAASKSDVAAAVPVVEEYASNQADGGYDGMTLALLQQLEPGLKNVDVISADASTYCIQSTGFAADKTYFKNGPNADIVLGTCAGGAGGGGA